jgi:hypothetical protein
LFDTDQDSAKAEVSRMSFLDTVSAVRMLYLKKKWLQVLQFNVAGFIPVFRIRDIGNDPDPRIRTSNGSGSVMDPDSDPDQDPSIIRQKQSFVISL